MTDPSAGGHCIPNDDSACEMGDAAATPGSQTKSEWSQ
jgi:hypothetical protein